MATMDALDKLPSDIVWEQDGHLTDIVLSTLSDGQEQIVPTEAIEHLEHCEHCTTRYGAEALLSLHASELIEQVSKVPVVAPVAQPVVTRVLPEKRISALPRWAIFATMFLAAGGAIPALLASSIRLASVGAAIGRSILLLSRGAVLIAKSETFTPLLWLSAVVLLISGLAVSRMSRPGSVNGLAQEGSV